MFNNLLKLPFLLQTSEKGVNWQNWFIWNFVIGNKTKNNCDGKCPLIETGDKFINQILNHFPATWNEHPV